MNNKLYHLSYKFYRDQILKEGLKPDPLNKGRAYVFAHNSTRFSKDWYPYCLDFDGFDNNLFLKQIGSDLITERYHVNKLYDIWEIDVDKLDNKWVEDKIGWEDMPHQAKDFYLKTNKEVNKEALTLCCLGANELEVENMCDFGIIKTFINPIINRSVFISECGFPPEMEFIKEEMILGINSSKSF